MERIKLELVPGGCKPIIHASQYDIGRPWWIDLLNNGAPYVLQEGDTVEYAIRKGDGLVVTGSIAFTPDATYVILVSTEQMCAIYGSNLGELKISSNGAEIGTGNFILDVEKATDGGEKSKSVIWDLQAQVDNCTQRALDTLGAEGVPFDNEGTDLESTNVEAAIKEVYEAIEAPKDVYTKTESDEKFATKTELSSYAEIDDSEVSEIKTYSSDKVTTLLSGKADAGTVASIDDNATSSDSVWSSEKTTKAIEEPLNLADAKVANNEINPLDCTQGYYLNHNTGELVADNNYFTSDYIPVTPQKYYVSYKTNHYAWYNESKVFISGSNTVVGGLAPNNAKYIRVDSTKVNKDLAFFRIGYVTPFSKAYGVDFPWLDNTNPINPERFERWGAYFVNLFNKDTATDGSYVKHDTGEKATSGTYFFSDYIKVKPSTTYVMSKGNRYAVYDSEYQYITGANLNGTDVEFTTPNNAAYMIVSNQLTEKDSLVVAEKVYYPYTQESFGIVVPWMKVLVPKSKYDGKTMVCLGDSITYGGYTDVIKSDSGIIAQNAGLSSGRYAYSDDSNQYINAFALHNIVDSIVSGDWTIPDSIQGVSGYTNQYNQIQVIKTIDFSKVDFVSIAYGTNDFSSATPLDNLGDEYDTEYFKGAIRYCLKKLLEAYPNLKIIGVTPCYRFWSENGTILYDSDEHTIGGMYLNDYVEAVEEVYAEFHLPCVNNYALAGINKYNRLQYFALSDGLHPNVKGRAIIGHRIAEGILMNY